MKKLLIATTLTVAALAATPLLAQQASDKKPAPAAATEGCPMMGATGKHAERHAAMQTHMREMHAGMGSHEGAREESGTHEEHK